MQVYTYKGLSKQEEDGIRAALVDPKPPLNQKSLRILETDKGATRKAKEDRQKKWIAEFKKQIEEEIEQRKKYTDVGPYSFEAGKPMDIDTATKMDEETKKPVPIVLLPVEKSKLVKKLDDLCKVGVFEKKVAAAEEKKEENKKR